MQFSEAIEAMQDGKTIHDIEDSSVYKLFEGEMVMGLFEGGDIEWWWHELAYFDYDNVTSEMWEVVDEEEHQAGE